MLVISISLGIFSFLSWTGTLSVRVDSLHIKVKFFHFVYNTARHCRGEKDDQGIPAFREFIRTWRGTCVLSPGLAATASGDILQLCCRYPDTLFTLNPQTASWRRHYPLYPFYSCRNCKVEWLA